MNCMISSKYFKKFNLSLTINKLSRPAFTYIHACVYLCVCVFVQVRLRITHTCTHTETQRGGAVK